MKWLPFYTFLLFLFSCNLGIEKTRAVVMQSPEHHTLSSNQSDPEKEALAKAFTIAIGDYIKACKKHNGLTFDTLFFLINPNLLDVPLPLNIEKTGIVVGPQEVVDKKRTYRKTLYAINLFGYITDVDAEFIFVTFYPDYQHDFDYFITYGREGSKKKLVMKELRYEDYVYNTKGDLEQIKVYVGGEYVRDKPIPKNK